MAGMSRNKLLGARGISLLFTTVVGALVAAISPPAGAAEPGPRPAVSALRLSEADLLARFTQEVRSQRQLRDRALAFWRTHFAAQAGELSARFTREEDWRPILAEAAALIDDFLDASLLPRAGAWPVTDASVDDDGPRQIFIETLDAKTGQRIRVLRPAPLRPVLFAPEPAEEKKRADEPAVDGAVKKPVPARAPLRAK